MDKSVEEEYCINAMHTVVAFVSLCMNEDLKLERMISLL